ncbi:MAG: ATP-binding cassette domain-containing protein [Planctomycetes bacterium]|nr:ATP-binding cassette domain-containing protein [Planctomycetota bacterium]
MRAPFDGIVVLKDADVGEVVSPNVQGGANARGSVVTMVDFATLEVQAELQETSCGTSRTKARPSQIYLDAWPDKAYAGRVGASGPPRTASKATVEVRVVFEDPDDSCARRWARGSCSWTPGARGSADDGRELEQAVLLVRRGRSCASTTPTGCSWSSATRCDCARSSLGGDRSGRVVVKRGPPSGETTSSRRPPGVSARRRSRAHPELNRFQHSTDRTRMPNSLIRLESVTKTYTRGGETLTVLDRLDLEMQAGGYFALMGPSGSGKTTLLNLLGGLDQADSGVIEVAGEDLTQLSGGELAHWRGANVGFVFQGFNLIPVLSAFENVALPLTLTPLSRAERRKHAEFALELVGLADRMHHRPRQLSGGQEQRVAIARAIATDPKVLLADEPTGDLDRASATQILELLTRLNREFKKTILMVTHDPHAAEYAQSIVHLDKGQLGRIETNPAQKNFFAQFAVDPDLLRDVPGDEGAARGPEGRVHGQPHQLHHRRWPGQRFGAGRSATPFR